MFNKKMATLALLMVLSAGSIRALISPVDKADLNARLMSLEANASNPDKLRTFAKDIVDKVKYIERKEARTELERDKFDLIEAYLSGLAYGTNVKAKIVELKKVINSL